MSASPVKWHREVLPEQWSRAAADLAARHALDDCYLAGGTGLALHFGHRRSVDLDLFRQTVFESAHLRNRLAGLDGLPTWNWRAAPCTSSFTA